MNHPTVILLLPGYTIDLGSRPDNFDFHSDEERRPWQASLATIAGVDTHNGRQLPGARLSLTTEQTYKHRLDLDRSIVRADPISLKADRDSATLVPAEFLDIWQEEAIEIIASLNEFTAQDNLDFFSDANGAWYLTGMPATALNTYPPSFLANRNASTFLPEGSEAASWRRLMTEIQMLLHTHPVNERRQLRGQMPINSVWFWGGAPLPETRTDVQDVQFYADDEQARVWAEVLGVDTLPLAQFAHGLDNSDRAAHSVVLDLSLLTAWFAQDAECLNKEYGRINLQWLEPLAARVRKQRIKQVEIITEDALYGICSTDTIKTTVHNSGAWYQRLAAFLTRSSR